MQEPASRVLLFFVIAGYAAMEKERAAGNNSAGGLDQPEPAVSMTQKQEYAPSTITVLPVV